MSMILSDSILTISSRLYDLALANKGPLGLADVYYGDQVAIPTTPVLCIEPGRKRRSLAGVPDLTENNIDVYFLLYHARVAETQSVRREAIQVAEAIEKFFHVNHFNLQDASGNQIIISGYFTDVDPGYSYKVGTLFSAVQMTWTAFTKTSVRNPPLA